MQTRLPCPVCDGTCAFLGEVDFNKSCEERRGKFLPPAGVAVAYFRCDRCGYCFAPELASWRPEEFASRIYNESYAQVDPDYFEVRPSANATMLISMCGEQARGIRHLDYGGGVGLLSELLRDAGWQSTSYNLLEGDVRAGLPGGFDLVTAFEVFEHSPDVRYMVADIASLLAPDGIVLFSTLVSDGHLAPGERVDWWYASPRNGHVSLFSRDSLITLGASEGFTCGSFSENLHAYWKKVPPWAGHMIRDR